MSGFKMRMRATLNCKICSAVVMETISDGTSMPSVTYSKGGTPKFMGKLLTENVKCPCCNVDVIVVTGRLGRGLFGTISMQSEQPPKPKEESAP